MYKFLIPLFALALLSGCGTPDPMKTTDTVTLTTSMGNITIELYGNAAPKAVENFVTHVENGYYNGLTFHRVIPDFMIQGGDPSGNGTGGESIWGKSFEDEQNEIDMDRGVLAMANRGPNTNGSQFFIITKMDGTPWLQGMHTAFGKVTDGMDVVDKISTVPRDSNDMPVEPVTYTMKIN